jgi:hypothetical protein
MFSVAASAASRAESERDKYRATRKLTELHFAGNLSGAVEVPAELRSFSQRRDFVSTAVLVNSRASEDNTSITCDTLPPLTYLRLRETRRTSAWDGRRQGGSGDRMRGLWDVTAFGPGAERDNDHKLKPRASLRDARRSHLIDCVSIMSGPPASSPPSGISLFSW